MAELLRAIKYSNEGDEGVLSPEESRKRQEGQMRLQGEKTGWRQTHEVLFDGEIFAGVPMIDMPKDPALERHYLLGFWGGAAEQIKDHVTLTRGLSEEQREGWKNVAQMIDGRMREALSAMEKGDTAKIDMGDVQDKINELSKAAQEEDTVRLAA
ncbi:MAG: hypothetical protein A2921_01695 [Candidatus Magasanikbacteria bacterium RIFCSPLOWO2_01_FULL_43_20b]|uniref:Uncharacterized protein n=1 Tax=Candidatus Magasanikbacteria bacterium RIFCSPLOWO2_12_FULL_43_12 TaxID=1798692 RepID=A0A1F6MW37_9BACT|nr:MAG: hypothetical protein A3C74_04240 [Candidatus Magasanikbacteria bacterium RIFCSPHIGHO2_02_FULL_44_13]OGH71687.1 MAG: hypothetical protein A3I93_02260 [Candidatus Magasanikbacteria bacterium RIFCSPLOWO2_02_FULL_43_22]OGH73206.1 MAG: hypothetical protein A2921_01695 [Candidatus Magasanikbacteria bacterium RIFCSPLOWO2_01_FULL_43_20b]OGH75710.1 MAG: hypothetical protein A3G00_03120 [Candidatus Magasanikbacteria bacterium RIFCSPLOWO2_12_FULL_43_12]